VLILKLLLVPLFLALISLAGKRWGAGVAGWLAGFPVVAGPILLFLAVERGAEFATRAAINSLSAVFASITFSLVYAWCSQRWNWMISLCAAMSAWLLAAITLSLTVDALWTAAFIALITLVAGPRLFPRATAASISSALPKVELALRMLAGAILTVLVTLLANNIGPKWSGLLAVFPVLGSVLSVFSHATHGAQYVAVLLRAMAMGMWSFAVFCGALAISLQHIAIPVAFLAAVGLAALTHLLVRWWVARLTAR
jgi:uncharacterized membrane protein (GlpM family)